MTDKFFEVAVGLLFFLLASLIMGFGSLPLVWLAGGTGEDLLSLMFFWWPLALLITLVATTSRAANNPKLRAWGIGPFFICCPGRFISLWLLYYFSPILLNGLSRIARLVECDSVAEMLFDYRWSVHPLAPLLTLILLAVIACVSETTEWLERQGLI